MQTELTFEQWRQLTPQKRTEYNATNIDPKKFEIDEEGYILNLEFSNDGNWRKTYQFDYLSNNFYRLKPQPTQAEITAKFVKDNDLKVGDKVKVVKKFENEEWIVWSKLMDKYIGEIGKVEEIHCDNIYVQFDDAAWSFLPQSLEKVEPTLSEQFKALIEEKGFEVGKLIVSHFYGKGKITAIDYVNNSIKVEYSDPHIQVTSYYHGKDSSNIEEINLYTPQYRPFESIAEFAPFRFKNIRRKYDRDITYGAFIYGAASAGIQIIKQCNKSMFEFFTFQEAFEQLEFIDLTTGERSPFGVEI